MSTPEKTRYENGDSSNCLWSDHLSSKLFNTNSPLHTPTGVVSASSAVFCRHCQTPLTTEQKSSGFCCSGCKCAHELINELGLSYYYELAETTDGVLANGKKLPLSFPHFDEAAFHRTYVEQKNDLSLITFHSQSLHCSACVWLLEKLPEIIPGVQELRVDLSRQLIRVLFRPERVSLSTIALTLSRLGYSPYPVALDPSLRKHETQDVTFILQLGVAAFCSMNVMLLFIGRYQGIFSGMEAEYQRFFAWISFLISIPAVAFSAMPFYRTSWSALRMRRLHIDLPITIAILGGFFASALNTLLGRAEIYFDTVTALIFLLLVGRWCQRRGMKRVASVADMLYSIAPISAERLLDDGARREVFVESLEAGNVVIVPPGERFPADGSVLSDEGFINNALISGESRPVKVSKGSEVFCGALNTGRELLLRVSAVGERSRLGMLLREVESAPLRESQISQFTDRVAKYFVVTVLALAAGTLLVCWGNGPWAALDRVFSLLIVSCPCALGIATPIALSLASAQAGRLGILLRRGTALEQAAKIQEVYFDKTGTLTEGELSVERSWLLDPNEDWSELKQIISDLETDVEHPIAAALREFAATTETRQSVIVSKDSVASGLIGLSANGDRYLLGSMPWLTTERVNTAALLNELSFERPTCCTIVGLAKNGALLAVFAIRDTLRPEVAALVKKLSEIGISSGILSGDSPDAVADIAKKVGIPLARTRAELNPEAKAAFIRTRPALFVGDGINDALALGSAAVGVGLKGGAEICLKVSDAFLLTPDLKLVYELIEGSKSTLRLIHRHLIISLIYNISAATFAVLGMIGPLAAALIMPASSFTVIALSLWQTPFRRRRWK